MFDTIYASEFAGTARAEQAAQAAEQHRARAERIPAAPRRTGLVVATWLRGLRPTAVPVH